MKINPEVTASEPGDGFIMFFFLPLDRSDIFHKETEKKLSSLKLGQVSFFCHF